MDRRHLVKIVLGLTALGATPYNTTHQDVPHGEPIPKDGDLAVLVFNNGVWIDGTGRANRVPERYRLLTG